MMQCVSSESAARAFEMWMTWFAFLVTPITVAATKYVIFGKWGK
jgi:hypothetical protein